MDASIDPMPRSDSMTTIPPLHSPPATPDVGTALRELASAAGRVLTSLRAALFPATEPQPLSAFEEAEQVRAVAWASLKTDRAFANELFAAAARHELLQR
jgi:hypothetical protein